MGEEVVGGVGSAAVWIIVLVSCSDRYPWLNV
jgi:hypothetical protein